MFSGQLCSCPNVPCWSTKSLVLHVKGQYTIILCSGYMVKGEEVGLKIRYFRLRLITQEPNGPTYKDDTCTTISKIFWRDQTAICRKSQTKQENVFSRAQGHDPEHSKGKRSPVVCETELLLRVTPKLRGCMYCRSKRLHWQNYVIRIFKSFTSVPSKPWFFSIQMWISMHPLNHSGASVLWEKDSATQGKDQEYSSKGFLNFLTHKADSREQCQEFAHSVLRDLPSSNRHHSRHSRPIVRTEDHVVQSWKINLSKKTLKFYQITTTNTLYF